jgi:hypothetical protein
MFILFLIEKECNLCECPEVFVFKITSLTNGLVSFVILVNASSFKNPL